MVALIIAVIGGQEYVIESEEKVIVKPVPDVLALLQRERLKVTFYSLAG
jgi:hypothetical protein